MVIGIDTSGGVCSVAAVSDSKLICEFSINHKKTHSAMLIPMLDDMLKKSELSLEDASLFAVASGPGSFTGLRIGAASAKGLSLALNKPVVGIPTLLALAYNMCMSKGIICPIMDARRKQVYTAAFNFESMGLEALDSPVIEPKAMEINDLMEELNTLGQEVTFLGDGVPVYKECIMTNAKIHVNFAPANLCFQRASSVALLGEIFADRGKSTDSEGLSLSYLRKPQAERERLGE